ncbi:hypothetical protein FE257_009340 [Aspergillus nanangensis]|uniref:Uncharacterized protein n=1 Tax=Aspergillus nanangensis TaxID=2582783 RepID=A0AAD4CK94_ASPNN|nr:hypothetical protein FE257_009340 [Aspergillus nanangensis]
MASRQQHGLSRTLPKNFTFPSMTMGEPRTPEPTSISLDAPPPPPRHSSYRLRRSRVRSGTDVFAQAEYDFTTFNSNNSDTPLPSIEFPPPHDSSVVYPCPIAPASNDHFLAPPRNRVALKTPPAQIRADPVDLQPTGPWSMAMADPQALGQTIERPSSVCSNASDSSISSIETFASRHSVGGSCTSAESETHDPFFHLEIAPKQITEPPLLPKIRQRRTRESLARERWTLDMDNHLWNIYQMYIQDPMITPFKMTPGSIPPLGVTHRVAREAKRTWEKKRSLLKRQPPSAPQQYRSGDSTPTPKADAAKANWPKSEASTRRRLKLLCKKKFSIAPHYQRMMQSRSPTPFMDLFSRSSQESSRVDGSNAGTAAYATRDLGVSLVSASVPGPLAQLAVGDCSPPESNSEWSNHHMSSPKPHATEAFSKRPSSFDEREMAPRLGSPFNYNTWGPNTSRNRVQRNIPKPRRETIHVTGSRLRSPPRMDLFSNTAPGISRAQPAPVEEPSEQETRHHLEELYRQGKLSDVGQRRVRIRNRGATTSSVNPKGLNQLFSPPSSASRNEETCSMANPVVSSLQSLTGESIKRLGSPFKINAPRRTESSGRFIKHAPSRSEPFAGGTLPQFLTSQNSQLGPQDTSVLPYDPTEQGISDAERIRRQILNMSYSRR